MRPMEISHKFILPTVQYPYMGAKMCCTELIGILAQWERFEGREKERQLIIIAAIQPSKQ